MTLYNHVSKLLNYEWQIMCYEGCKVYNDGKDEYVLLDWDKDVMMTFTLTRDSVKISNVSYDLDFQVFNSFKDGNQVKMITINNEPEDDEE